ncbi:MAG: ThuA domain-containing protein [Kiritimatiellae bacterium]|nr:ThuA domain-containing protein [Kiritimatiellia bacterium]
MRKALIVRGGWTGHQPVEVSELLRDILQAEDFDVEISDTLDAFLDVDKLRALDLMIPIWTMGKITKEQVGPVTQAAADGVGIAGCHGGMCDAFRDSVQWQFIMGGNWVSHPGGGDVEYRVNIRKGSSPIVEGLKDFNVKSEQYYLHVDPAIEVLATTRFPTVNWYHSANGAVDVPVVWTKRWGLGRVFYTSLGHHADILEMETPREIMRRGMLWAAESRRIAVEQGLDSSLYKSEKQMF